MRKTRKEEPRNKTKLITGVIFCSLSPLLAILAPPLLRPLTCIPPKSGLSYFPCVKEDILTGLIIAVVMFFVGALFILASLKLRRK